MRVKLLNTSLIRSFGGVFVNMTDSQAEMYIKRGDAIQDAKSIKESQIDKSLKRPSEDKMVWSPPEQKLFDTTSLNNNVFPGPNDKLFNQIQ